MFAFRFPVGDIHIVGICPDLLEPQTPWDGRPLSLGWSGSSCSNSYHYRLWLAWNYHVALEEVVCSHCDDGLRKSGTHRHDPVFEWVWSMNFVFGNDVVDLSICSSLLPQSAEVRWGNLVLVTLGVSTIAFADISFLPLGLGGGQGSSCCRVRFLGHFRQKGPVVLWPQQPIHKW
jgi:hypothetical protein